VEDLSQQERSKREEDIHLNTLAPHVGVDPINNSQFSISQDSIEVVRDAELFSSQLTGEVVLTDKLKTNENNRELDNKEAGLEADSLVRQDTRVSSTHSNSTGTSETVLVVGNLDLKDLDPKYLDQKDLDPKDIDPKDIDPTDLDLGDLDPKDLDLKDIAEAASEWTVNVPQETKENTLDIGRLASQGTMSDTKLTSSPNNVEAELDIKLLPLLGASETLVDVRLFVPEEESKVTVLGVMTIDHGTISTPQHSDLETIADIEVQQIGKAIPDAKVFLPPQDFMDAVPDLKLMSPQDISATLPNILLLIRQISVESLPNTELNITPEFSTPETSQSDIPCCDPITDEKVTMEYTENISGTSEMALLATDVAGAIIGINEALGTERALEEIVPEKTAEPAVPNCDNSWISEEIIPQVPVKFISKSWRDTNVEDVSGTVSETLKEIEAINESILALAVASHKEISNVISKEIPDEIFVEVTPGTSTKIPAVTIFENVPMNILDAPATTLLGESSSEIYVEADPMSMSRASAKTPLDEDQVSILSTIADSVLAGHAGNISGEGRRTISYPSAEACVEDGPLSFSNIQPEMVVEDCRHTVSPSQAEIVLEGFQSAVSEIPDALAVNNIEVDRGSDSDTLAEVVLEDCRGTVSECSDDTAHFTAQRTVKYLHII